MVYLKIYYKYEFMVVMFISEFNKIEFVVCYIDEVRVLEIEVMFLYINFFM